LHPSTPLNANAALTHAAFYKFVTLADPSAVAARLRELCHALQGSILVATEGVNGMVAGSAAALAQFEAALGTDAALHGQLAGIAFKHSPCSTAPFARMKVHVKPEIVPLGISGIDVVASLEAQADTIVSPAKWRELIAEPDVVLLDNRNSFEYKLGHFAGAIDPQVQHFRDFPQYVQAHAAEWRASGKRVAMYCTGGIRCEKTSAWMADMGLPVYQLDGGILNYFLQMPDAERDWQGECFVFDRRVALDTKLQQTATTLDDVYAGEADGEWRLQRARRLHDAV
jgi:UPF0176 protein